jgi:hypothetical protein
MVYEKLKGPGNAKLTGLSTIKNVIPAPLDILLSPSYNPAQHSLKTLTRTSTLQSDFQRARQ